MATTTPLIWLITGSSVGLGAALATHVLKSGHKVIATARNIASASEANPEIASLGGQWMTLDVTSRNSGLVIQEALTVFGRIDVLVNNAGYSLLGAVEDISEEEARDQFDTNFFGPLRLIRSILPSFRAQRSGTIINVSSVAGIDGLPTCGLYAGSKFALEGLSESLAHEVSDFNIRVLVVEPGAFRTRFLQSCTFPERETTSDYLGNTVGNTLKYFEGLDGMQPGDPVKCCSTIFDIVTKSGVASGLEKEYLRLPIGIDALDRVDKKIRHMKETVEALRGITSNTNF